MIHLCDLLKENLIKDEETYILTNELNYSMDDEDLGFVNILSIKVYSKAKGKDIKKAIEIWWKKEIKLSTGDKENIVYEQVSVLKDCYVEVYNWKGNLVKEFMSKKLLNTFDLVKYILKNWNNPKYFYS